VEGFHVYGFFEKTNWLYIGHIAEHPRVVDRIATCLFRSVSRSRTANPPFDRKQHQMTVQKKPVVSVNSGGRSSEPLVSAKVVATMLGCTPKHVYKMAKAGKIPNYRYGASVKFKVSEIEEWLLARHAS
jgi:excisionase family DNA binding protein